MAQVVTIPAGAIDGVNATFTTPTPYQAGSLSVWVNGQQLPPDAVTYTSPSTGVFDIADADCIPKAGAWGTDTIACDYNNPDAITDVVRVDELLGTIEDVTVAIAGAVVDVDQIRGEVADSPVAITGSIADEDPIAAVVADSPVAIFGTVEVT